MERILVSGSLTENKILITCIQTSSSVVQLVECKYIMIGGYDMLHTQSREYIADTLIEALDNWEAYYKEKGDSV